MEIKKDRCVPALLYLISGLFFIVGGLRFYAMGDYAGAGIYSLAGILFFMVSAGFYYMKHPTETKKQPSESVSESEAIDEIIEPEKTMPQKMPELAEIKEEISEVKPRVTRKRVKAKKTARKTRKISRRRA